MQLDIFIALGMCTSPSHVSSSLDFMATVNEILGLAYPNASFTVDSKSLLPLLDGRLPVWDPLLLLWLWIWLWLQGWLTADLVKIRNCAAQVNSSREKPLFD